jgi:hypothetical protein
MSGGIALRPLYAFVEWTGTAVTFLPLPPYMGRYWHWSYRVSGEVRKVMLKLRTLIWSFLATETEPRVKRLLDT